VPIRLPWLQLLHHTLDQLLRVSQILHDYLNIHNRLARPALALAIDAVLSNQRHSIRDHVHRHGQPTSRDSHHGFVVFQFFLLLVEYRHAEIVTAVQRSA